MTYAGRTSPLVSVIIVTHDSAGTIRRALESVQNQTVRDLETIVVDDGSSDKTCELVSAMAERDLSISLSQTDGAGIRRALDLALSRARGKYLLFFDADGWADQVMVEDLVSLAEEDQLELCIAGFSAVPQDGSRRDSERVVNQAPKSFVVQHEFRANAWQIFDADQLTAPSAKLFLRERVERLGLSFTAASRGEAPFILAYLADVSRVGLTGQVHYHVETGSASCGGGLFARDYGALECQYGHLVELYRHWGLDGDVASMSMIQSRYFEGLVDCVTSVCANRAGMSSDERRRAVREIVSSDHARLAASFARPRSMGEWALAMGIKSGNIDLVYTQGSLAAMLRRTSPSISPFYAMP